MYINNAERIIGEYLNKENQRKQKNHKRSGKITPSRLAYPTQQAILSLLGVPQVPFTNTVLGIFKRGEAVENAVFRAYQAAGATSTQTEHSYRGCYGKSDIDWQGWTIEIKSTGQKKFWRLVKERQPQPSHAIQLAYYLASEERNAGRLNYINADNLAALDLVVYRQHWQIALDYRIDCIHACILAGALPDFVALEPFHKVKQYMPYPEFYGLKGEEAEELLRVSYPKEYQRLKNKELAQICETTPKTELVHSLNELSIYSREIASHATTTTICGGNCVLCSIHRLSIRSEATEKSLRFFVPCLRWTKLRAPAGKSMQSTITK